MKIILEENELVDILRNHFPKHLLPLKTEIIDFSSEGYPVKKFVITLKGREETKSGFSISDSPA